MIITVSVERGCAVLSMSTERRCPDVRVSEAPGTVIDALNPR